MKKVAIAIIGILLALYFAAYGPWRTGGQREKDSAGGLNVAQDGSRQATGAQEAKQSVKGVQQPVKEVKQRFTNAQGAIRHGKGVKHSMAGMRRNMEQRGDNLEVQVIEMQPVEQWTIDVSRPTERVEVISVEVEEPAVEPMYIEDMRGSSDWSLAPRINVAVPAPQECSTPYGWVELIDP
jgi:type II secretory pathway pseudopilin PulG